MGGGGASGLACFLLCWGWVWTVYAPRSAGKVWTSGLCTLSLKNVGSHMHGLHGVRVLRNVHIPYIVHCVPAQVKNPSTQVAEAARRIPAKGRLLLTGTPIQVRSYVPHAPEAVVA